MKIPIFLLVAASSIPGFGQDVFKRAERAAERGTKRTVERRVERKAAEKTDEALDVLFGEGNKKPARTPADQRPAAEPTRQEAPPQSTSIPAPETSSAPAPPAQADPELNYTGTTLFEATLASTPPGDYPAQFVSSSGGEVVTLNDRRGLWLYPNSNTVPQVKSLPENFALAFDLTLQNVPASLYNTYFNVYFQSLNVLKHNNPKNKYGAFGFSLWGDAREHQLDLFNKNARYEVAEKIPYDVAGRIVGKTSHFVALVHGSRLRLFINGTKVADSPSLLTDVRPASVNIRLNGTKKELNQRFVLSNVKITALEKDLRTQLLDEGRFVTSNILFEPGSARIAPASFELLKQIGNVLRESDARFDVVGHTDSDGDAATNLRLSEQRARSVRDYLMEKFRIAENRLTVSGKGESEPVADNATAEGKSQNRRVEFRKR